MRHSQVWSESVQPESPVVRQWVHEGFTLWPMAGRFVPRIAPVYFVERSEELVFRVELTADHCNGAGIVHGGFLSTMADIWLGYNLARRLEHEARFATASLTVDYLRPATAGQWLESSIDRVKTGSLMCFASGVIMVDQQPVVAMRASFARVPGKFGRSALEGTR